MSPKQINEAVAFWMKLGVAVFAVLILTVWEHVEAIRLEHQMVAMRKEADRLTYENGHMQNLIHQWTSPSHLDTVARQDYQMQPLDSTHVIGIHKP